MASKPEISYRIAASRPGAHLFDVECTVTTPDPGGQRFFMPAWIPGSYMVRDYARHVGHVEAVSGDVPVVIAKTDKSTWRCAPCAGPLTVRYEVFAFDMSVRGAYLDTRHGFFNGVCVFLAVCDQEAAPVSLDIVAPAAADDDWRVATGMTRAGAPAWGFGRYAAANYDELIDHPVEMGGFDNLDFVVSDTEHHFVLCGRHTANAARLTADASRICAEHAALFGEFPDMERYVFLTRVLGEGYGGLEHRASSSLMCRRDELPGSEDKVTPEYRRLLGLVSHEYFHLWNVKRIRPAAFTPYRLEAESYTRQLWVFEGITSYYDDLALARSGVIDANAYFELLSDNLARVLSMPSHGAQTLAESSFDAWTKFYRPTENSPNAVVSYYGKGAIVALLLDLAIRQRSGDAQSLDDVMRALWARYHGGGLPEDGFEELAAHVTGLDLRPFFDRAIRTTAALDIERALATVGLRLAPLVNNHLPVSLGLKVPKDGVLVGAVFNGGAAEAVGVSPGDQLVALDGIRVTATGWPDCLKRYRPGDVATLHVFRRDELLAFEVTFKAPLECRWKVEIDPTADARCAERRERWLRSAGGR